MLSLDIHMYAQPKCKREKPENINRQFLILQDLSYVCSKAIQQILLPKYIFKFSFHSAFHMIKRPQTIKNTVLNLMDLGINPISLMNSYLHVYSYDYNKLERLSIITVHKLHKTH